MNLKKIVIIGDAEVGKTSIVNVFAGEEFQEKHTATIGADFKSKNLKGKNIGLQLWDLAGQERFQTILNLYYNKANAVIVVYDIAKRTSFDHVEEHLNKARESAPEGAIFTLVGNKLDMPDHREVPEADAREYAEKNGLHFIEVSAKDKTNIDALFDMCLKDPSLSAEEPDSVELTDAASAKVMALRNYANILRNLSEEKWSKNDVTAGNRKAWNIDKLVPEGGFTQKTIEEILRNNSESVLDNRSNLHTPIFYKIHSFFAGKVNPFQGDSGRYCESKTEELLVDLYNSFNT